ncbi:hybrid sensor histidine kinase/response regulator [Paraliomyxa miuraensis]|uniref:hybrid sensor histidine kinase/response regulator n=1 Tax=Paraliomyxa miuraensis TaxID=376150 RepID=UPI00224F7250|nr:ATP-binding protein [Paraliomyxa miuraensis]MCX4242610.1 response regulator [Paraliomyxa miuraensis]
MAELPHSARGRSSPPIALNFDSSTLLEDLDVGVIVLGPSGEAVYANRLALSLVGVPREQLLGVTSFDPTWDMVRPDGTPFPPDERPDARVLATGKPVRDVVLGLRRGDTERSWLLVNAIPHISHDRVPYVVVTLSDISSEQRRTSLLQQIKLELERAVEHRTTELASSVEDLRRTTEELERSRATLERVTEAVPGTLFQALRRADGEVRLLFVSAHLRDLCGVEPAAAMAEPGRLLTLAIGDELPGAVKALEDAERTQTTFEHELQLRSTGGRVRWVRVRAVPRTEARGVVWSGVALDVTEQRNIAQQVQVTQTREAIGSITAGIAHNFNNALAVLVPNLEESLATAPEPMRASLQESLQAAFSTAALVKQLMVVARGGLTDRTEPVDIVAMIRDIAALCRRIFRGRVTVTETVEVGCARVMAHGASLRQVLLNLCINARDALHDVDDGHIELELRVAGRSPGSSVVLKVRDDGCGMDAATVARMGEPFFTTKDPGRSTGLGVASAYATVRNLGGAILCESTPGKGTAFTISLPLLDFGEERARQPTPQRAAPDAVARGRLLIIDDESLVRSALRKVLTRRGFSVDEAANGLEGLARVEQAPEPYQGVLLDLSMPGISGERVLEQLRVTHPDLPVVILSGFVEDPAKVAAANAVLHKPLTSKLLVETLDRVLV